MNTCIAGLGIDVSLIIVNWNTRQLLLDCIASIYEQTQTTRFEIIVVDNGSTDQSVEALHAAYPHVTVIENGENLGFAKANNIGITASTGTYVCLVNSDIKILDRCLDRMFAYMEQQQAIAVLGPKTVNENMAFRLNCREFPRLWTSFCEACALDKILPHGPFVKTRLLTDISLEKPSTVDVLSGCLMMVRRTAMEQVGLLDERFYIYGEDRDWCKRFHSSNWDVVFYPAATAIHYGGGSSSAAPLKFKIELLKSDFLYWQKYHGRLAQILFRLIRFAHYGIRMAGNFLKGLFSKTSDPQAALQAQNYRACLAWVVFGRLPKQLD